MAIDLINNLITTPKETNQRTAQTATQGTEKMLHEKAGGQGASAPSSGRVNVMGNLGVQQQEQQADQAVNQAVAQNQQQFQQQGQQQQELDNKTVVWNEQELAVQNAYENQVTAMMDSYRKSQSQLDSQASELGVQALTQTVRLQDQAYVDELNITMNKELLAKQISAEELTEQLAFGETYQRMRDQGDWMVEFEKEKIDTEFANSKQALLQAFRNGKQLMDADRRSQNWGNVSSMVDTGMQGYQGYQDSLQAEDQLNRQRFEDSRTGYDRNKKY